MMNEKVDPTLLRTRKNPEKTQKMKKPQGQGLEAKRVESRLAGWDINESPARKGIAEQFPQGVTHYELKEIAKFICREVAGLKLDRDATRDNRVLVKWFDENWECLKDIISRTKLCDEYGDPIL